MIKGILILITTASCSALSTEGVFSYDSSAVERVSCEAGQTVCDNLRQCVSKELFCNGYPDCDDGSDEKKPHCFYRYFNCEGHPKFRIRSYLRCDGEVDCPDGSDEIGCLTKPPAEEPSTTTPVASDSPVDSTTNGMDNSEHATLDYDTYNGNWSTTTETELFQSPIPPDSFLASGDEVNVTITSEATTEASTMFTVTHTLEDTLTRLDKGNVSIEHEDIKSEEIQEGLIAGFSKWITIAVAFFAGLALIVAAVAHLYIWIWKKSQKQPPAQPSTQFPEINNDDLFRTYSFSSAGSTSRSLRSSDFYFINPSIVVVDSYH